MSKKGSPNTLIYFKSKSFFYLERDFSNLFFFLRHDFKIIGKVIQVLFYSKNSHHFKLTLYGSIWKQYLLQNPVHFGLDIVGTTLHKSKLYAMLFERLQTILHKKKSSEILSQYSWDNFVQVKILCNDIREVPCNNAEEKILCKIVLILLGKHYTAENPMQCCPRGSRQLCIRRNPVQCCLNTLRITLHRSKPYAILSERLQPTLHKKILCNFSLILLWQHCTGQNPMQCCPRGSRQLCIGKTFHSMLTDCAILVLCNVFPEAPSNISQEKNQAIQGMSFEQHLVTLVTYVYIRSFTSTKM